MCGLQIITATERMCESYAEADAIEPLYHRKAAQVARTAIVSYVRHPAFGMESVGKAADGARAEASLQHAHTSVCDSLMHVLSCSFCPPLPLPSPNRIKCIFFFFFFFFFLFFFKCDCFRPRKLLAPARSSRRHSGT